MNFKRRLPLTLDLLLNANECTQQHLSKYIRDPLKRETNGEEKDTGWSGRHEMELLSRQRCWCPALLQI